MPSPNKTVYPEVIDLVSDTEENSDEDNKVTMTKPKLLMPNGSSVLIQRIIRAGAPVVSIIVPEALLVAESTRLAEVFAKKREGVVINSILEIPELKPGSTKHKESEFAVLSWSYMVWVKDIEPRTSPWFGQTFFRGIRDGRLWNGLELWISWIIGGKKKIGNVHESVKLAAIAVAHYLKLKDTSFIDELWLIKANRKHMNTICFRCGGGGHLEQDCNGVSLSPLDQVKFIREYEKEHGGP